MEFVITIGALITIGFILSRRVTVFEYEKALKYNKGKYIKILEPGKYFIFSPNVSVVKVDVRPKFISIPGQEVMSSDGISIKVSIAAEYEINAPYLALNKVEDIISSREEINKLLMEKSYEKSLELGLNLKSVGVKDIMLPGELKKIFSQVIQARKESLALLEKARGETATLRNLANASKLIADNPALMKLKLLQSTGNTLVVGLPENIINVKPNKDKL